MSFSLKGCFNIKFKLLLFFLLLSVAFVNADLFLHEPQDENYSISNIGLTTQPRLNDFLAFEFDLADNNSNLADNIHVHIKTFDEDGRLVHDYSQKFIVRSDDPISIQNLNHPAIEKSTGYTFFRTLPNQQNTLEERFVSNDAGQVKVLLFLNGCNVGETQNCYFQTGSYTINIVQEGLDQSESFVVQGQKIQGFSVVQFLSTISNNTDTLIIILGMFFIVVIIVAILLFFLLKQIGVIK